MDLKTFDGLIAEQFEAVAAFDQCDAFGRQALEFDRSHFGAILLALALALRLFVVIQLAFNAVRGTVEEVDGRPEQIRKVRLKPGRSRRVTMMLNARAFSYWSEAARGWRSARGCYKVAVGNSSRNLPLRAVIARGGGSCKAA